MFVILNDAAALVLYMPLVLIVFSCCAYLSLRYTRHVTQ